MELMKQCAKLFEEKLLSISIPVVESQEIPYDDTNFATVMERIKKLLPDGGIISQFLNGKSLTDFYVILDAAGLKPPKYLVTSIFTETDQMKGDLARKMKGHVFWVFDWPEENDLTQNIRQSINNLFSYKTELNSIMVHVFIALHGLKAAIEKAEKDKEALGSNNPYHEIDLVRRALYNTEIDSPIGKVTFYSNNHISNTFISGTVACDIKDETCKFTETQLSHFTSVPDPFAAEVSDSIKICDYNFNITTRAQIPPGITSIPAVKLVLVYAMTGEDKLKNTHLYNAFYANVLYLKNQKGVPINPVLYDTQSNLDVTKKIAEEIAGDDSVMYIFGCGDTECKDIIQAAIKGKEKVFFFQGKYQGQECNYNTIYSGIIPNQYLSSEVEYAISMGYTKKYVIVRDNKTADKLIMTMLKDIIGLSMQLVDELVVNNKVFIQSKNINKIVEAVENGGYIFTALPLTAMKNLMLQLTQRRVNRTRVMIISNLDFMDVNEIPAEHRENILMASSFHLSTHENYKTYMNIISHYTGLDDYNSFTENMYISLYFWNIAHEKESSTSLADFYKALYKQSFVFNDGPTTIQPNHHLSRNIYLLRFKVDGSYYIANTIEDVKPLPWNWNLEEFYGKICDYSNPSIGEINDIQVITILLGISQTGEESMGNRGILDTMNAYVLKANANGGLLSKELVVSVVDIGSDATVCQTAITNVLNSNVEIFAIFSTAFQECRLNILPKLIEKKILYFNIGNSVNEECNKEIFHFGSDASSLSLLADQYFYTISTEYVIISSNQPYATAYSSFAEKYISFKKYNLIYYAKIGYSESEVENAINNMLSSNVPKGQLILYFGSDMMQLMFCNKLEAITSDPSYYTLISFLTGNEASRNGAPTFLTLRSYLSSIKHENNDLFKAQLGPNILANGINEFMSNTWTAINMWVESVNNTKSTDTENLQNYIHSNEFFAPYGNVKMSNQNYVSRSLYRTDCVKNQGCGVEPYLLLIVSVETVVWKPLMNDYLYQCDLLDPEIGSKKHQYSITVGIIAPLSGIWKYRGASMVDSLLYSISQLNNKGGLLGYIIQTSIYDSKSTITDFKEATTALLKQDSIKVIFGGIELTEIKASIVEISRMSKLWFYPGHPIEESCYDNIIFGGPLPNQVTHFLLFGYITSREKFVILTSDDLSSLSYSNSLKAAGDKLRISSLVLKMSDSANFKTKINEFLPNNGIIYNCIRHEDNQALLPIYKSLKSNYRIFHLLIDEYDFKVMGISEFDDQYYVSNYGEAINTMNSELNIPAEAATYYDNIHNSYADMQINGPVMAVSNLFNLWSVAAKRVNSFDGDSLRQSLSLVKSASPTGLFELSVSNFGYNRIFLSSIKSGVISLVDASLGSVEPLVWNPYYDINQGYTCHPTDTEKGTRYKAPSIEIGAIFDLLLLDIEQWKAMSYSVKEVNKDNGILGKQLIMRYEFSDSKTEEFYNITEGFASNDDIFAVFGCSTVPCKKRIAPLFEKYRKLLFYSGNAEGMYCSKYVISCGITPYQRIKSSIEYFENRQQRNAIILYENTD